MQGIRVAVDVTVTITTGETGTMDEMEVGEGGEEEDEVVITQVGMIDRRTGTGIVMTGDRYLLDDTHGVDEADRGVLHQEVPGMEIFHEGTNGPGALPVQTHADPSFPHNQPP